MRATASSKPLKLPSAPTQPLVRPNPAGLSKDGLAAATPWRATKAVSRKSRSPLSPTQPSPESG